MTKNAGMRAFTALENIGSETGALKRKVQQSQREQQYRNKSIKKD